METNVSELPMSILKIDLKELVREAIEGNDEKREMIYGIMNRQLEIDLSQIESILAQFSDSEDHYGVHIASIIAIEHGIQTGYDFLEKNAEHFLLSAYWYSAYLYRNGDLDRALHYANLSADEGHVFARKLRVKILRESGRIGAFSSIIRNFINNLYGTFMIVFFTNDKRVYRTVFY